METKNLPFTKQDILNEFNKKFGDNKKVFIDYGECTCGASVHKYYWVRLNWKEFTDNGAYSRVYSFFGAVQNLFNELEDELKKENILFVKDKKQIEYGVDVWHCPTYREMECVSSIVKIEPSKSFLELKEFLKKKANYDLDITKWYNCDVCQKRSSKGYSNFYYIGENENYCKRLLDKIKAEYKSGNKVVVNLEPQEDMDCYDRNRYEYEQYGSKVINLVVKISTPTGRNERIIK